MATRLTTRLFVNALMRRAASAGGQVTVLSHGDDSAGGLLLVCAHKGQISAILERGSDAEGRPIWQPLSHQLIDNKEKLQEYCVRRAAQDSDLWQVELDIPDAERFAAESLGAS